MIANSVFIEELIRNYNTDLKFWVHLFIVSYYHVRQWDLKFLNILGKVGFLNFPVGMTSE